MLLAETHLMSSFTNSEGRKILIILSLFISCVCPAFSAPDSREVVSKDPRGKPRGI